MVTQTNPMENDPLNDTPGIWDRSRSSHEWWERGPWDDWETSRKLSDEETRRWWASRDGSWDDCNICGGAHPTWKCPEHYTKEWSYDVSYSPGGSVYWARPRSTQQLRGVGETPADTLRGLRQSSLRSMPEKMPDTFNDATHNTWASLAAGSGPGRLQALGTPAGSKGFNQNIATGYSGFNRNISMDNSDLSGFVDGARTWNSEETVGGGAGGVKEIRCPTWNGKDRSEWRAVRKRLNTWSLVDSVRPQHQGPVFLDALTGAAARASGHLRPERLMYPGGLLEVVAVLDEAYAAHAESTRFTTFDAGVEPAPRARKSPSCNVPCTSALALRESGRWAS